MWAFNSLTKGIKLSRCILGTVGSGGFWVLTHNGMDCLLQVTRAQSDVVNRMLFDGHDLKL